MSQLELFRYQILVRGKLMHPTKSEPYIFDTYKEALKMVDICYGLGEIGRTIEIKTI